MIREQDNKDRYAKDGKDDGSRKQKREPAAVEAQMHLEHHDQHALGGRERHEHQDLTP